MFNKVIIRSEFKHQGVFRHRSFNFIGRMLRSLKLTGVSVSFLSKKGAPGIVLSESPFHYPTAKKILDPSRSLIVLESSYCSMSCGGAGDCSVITNGVINNLIISNRPYVGGSIILNKTNVVFFLHYKPSLL